MNPQEAEELSKPPKVYFSYSHDSSEHKERVLALANRLRTDGIDCTIDQYATSPDEGWPRWIARQIEESDLVLIVCTENYYRRFRAGDEPDRGKGVAFEGSIIRERLYERASRKPRFVPVLFDSSDAKHIPEPLTGYTYFVLDSEDGYERLYRMLTGSEGVGVPPLGRLRKQKTKGSDRLSKTQTEAPTTETKEAESPGRASSEETGRRFRVAFSFVVEKRAFVEKVATILAEQFGRQTILYDRFHAAEFARPDLDVYLSKIYLQESDLIVLVLSADYTAKSWNGFEWHGILPMFSKAAWRVVLGRFDHATVQGLRPDAGVIELDDITPKQFATLILERLALNEGRGENYYVKDQPPPKDLEEEKSPRESAIKGPKSDEPTLVVGPAGFYPEFRAVGVDGKVVDYLEVEAEAVRLAELIALRETNLPLAVGLFGNWGSGKSHFMGLLRMHMLNRANAARRTDGATDGRWCKEIVPIVFNAWHYLDSNLWASLVSEIFERLFERLQPKGDALQKVQEKLGEVGGAMARAQEEVVLTQAAVTKAAGELQTAQREAEQAQTAYAGMMDEFKELLPEFKEPVSPERIADLLGVEPELATLSALKKKNQELAGLAEQVRELSRRIIAPRGRAYRMGVLLVAGCLGPLLLWLAQKAMPSVEQWLKDAGAWVRPALEWVMAVLTAVAPFFIKLQKRLHEMRDLQKQAEDAQKAKEKTPKVKEAKEQLETANAVATQAELQLAETKARQKQIQKEMEELAPGRRVSRFIEDRARSAEYRGQLGLVSLARRDFEELSNLFANRTALEEKIEKLNEEAKALETTGKEEDKTHAKRKREEADGLPRLHDSIDRIVLFVDDLDRCQPEKVVDVLQAVHLLLAFPLFAVIVGVDQRCLRTSLQEQFKGLLKESGGKEYVATPLDYLEKIFHVPFHLPEMDADGFGNFIWKLSAPPTTETESNQKKVGETATETETAKAAPDHPAPMQPAQSSLPIATGPAKAAAVLVGSVPLQDWERTALKSYHPLIRTPRAATRLLNTYRLVRAGLKTEDWGKFHPNGSRPGEAAVAMLLLAVAAGHPSVAREWFAALRRAGGKTWLIPPTDESRKRAGWTELEAALNQFARLAGATEKDANERLQKWLPLLPTKDIEGTEPLLETWLERIERFAF